MHLWEVGPHSGTIPSAPAQSLTLFMDSCKPQRGGGLKYLRRSHASRRKRRKGKNPVLGGYNWATLSLGDINTGTWPSKLGEVSNVRHLIMSPAGLGTKNICAGEDQRQFTRQNSVTTLRQTQRLHRKTDTLPSSKRRPHFETNTGLGENKNFDRGFRRDPKPGITVLARTSSDLTDRVVMPYSLETVRSFGKIYRLQGPYSHTTSQQKQTTSNSGRARPSDGLRLEGQRIQRTKRHQKHAASSSQSPTFREKHITSIFRANEWPNKKRLQAGGKANSASFWQGGKSQA
jgi:hypothetical protein